jgi:hypothetical protein
MGSGDLKMRSQVGGKGTGGVPLKGMLGPQDLAFISLFLTMRWVPLPHHMIFTLMMCCLTTGAKQCNHLITDRNLQIRKAKYTFSFISGLSQVFCYSNGNGMTHR